VEEEKDCPSVAQTSVCEGKEDEEEWIESDTG
jgi:hypothetical protein